MTKRCPNCKHIYLATESHECPTSEYTAMREELVSQAAQAQVTEENEWELCKSVEDVASLVSDCFPNHLPKTNPFTPGDLHDAYECAVSNESESLYRQEERIAYEERQGPQHRPDYYGN